MRQLVAQCVAVFILALLTDVIACVHIRTLVNDHLIVSSATIFILHILGFWSLAWFVDHKESHPRWWITIPGGLGAALGTATVILCGW